MKIDSVIFDIDGVLIDTRASFPCAAVDAVRYIVQLMVPHISDVSIDVRDVRAFKRAGGFNSDWDIVQGLSALLIAQKNGFFSSDAGGSYFLQEFAIEASRSYEAGNGGMQWIHEIIPSEYIPSDEMTVEIMDQFYWGTALYQRFFGNPKSSVPDCEGYTHTEMLLAEEKLLDQLYSLGASKFGIITGRVGPELEIALERFTKHFRINQHEDLPSQNAELNHDDWKHTFLNTVVDPNMFKKPDPQALLHVINHLKVKSGVFVGDTRDDLNLVIRYQREQAEVARAVPFWSVIIAAGEDEKSFYYELGADVVIPSVNHLPEAIQILHQKAGQ